MNLILASSSPRRRELLARLTSDFVVVPSRVDEIETGAPAKRAVEAARAKARAVGRTERGVVIGADTIVVVGDEILGKPETRDQAKQMLRRMSGRVHSVLTGLCVWNTETKEERTHCEETQVTFRSLDAEEIEAYLDTGEYRDKAGAYAIQGAAAKFISRIQGDYTNVIGLPLCRLTLLLREVGVRR
jgi:septum formation protein